YVPYPAVFRPHRQHTKVLTAGNRHQDHHPPTWSRRDQRPRWIQCLEPEPVARRYHLHCNPPVSTPASTRQVAYRAFEYAQKTSGVLPDSEIRKLQLKQTAGALLPLFTGCQIGLASAFGIAHSQQNVASEFRKHRVEGIRFSCSVQRGESVLILTCRKLD